MLGKIYINKIHKILHRIYDLLIEAEDLADINPQSVKNYKNTDRILRAFWEHQPYTTTVTTLDDLQNQIEVFDKLYDKLYRQLPEFGTAFEDILMDLDNSITELEELLFFIENR